MKGLTQGCPCGTVTFDIADDFDHFQLCQFPSLRGDVPAVPAGSLDGEPTLSPEAHVFWPERAGWYDEALQPRHCPKFIESNT
jgi:hypothetical protein